MQIAMIEMAFILKAKRIVIKYLSKRAGCLHTDPCRTQANICSEWQSNCKTQRESLFCQRL